MCAHPHHPGPTQLSNPGYATADISGAQGQGDKLYESLVYHAIDINQINCRLNTFKEPALDKCIIVPAQIQ